jgi:hypothetical protein
MRFVLLRTGRTLSRSNSLRLPFHYETYLLSLLRVAPNVPASLKGAWLVTESKAGTSTRGFQQRTRVPLQ